MRDIEHVCSLYREQRCCTRDLDGQGDERLAGYCPNIRPVSRKMQSPTRIAGYFLSVGNVVR
jgi:hypothetical protein